MASDRKLLFALLVGACLALSVSAGYEDVAAFCNWVGQNTGYGCDGPLARAAWRTYNSARAGRVLSTCDDFCRYRLSKPNGGECRYKAGTGYTDKSTWCYDTNGARYSCYCK